MMKKSGKIEGHSQMMLGIKCHIQRIAFRIPKYFREKCIQIKANLGQPKYYMRLIKALLILTIKAIAK